MAETLVYMFRFRFLAEMFSTLSAICSARLSPFRGPIPLKLKILLKYPVSQASVGTSESYIKCKPFLVAKTGARGPSAFHSQTVQTKDENPTLRALR